MAIPTVDSGDEVRAVDHNSIVGLLNGTPDDATTAYAQPVKLNRLNDPALYSMTVGNQDTVNGLIAQFSYGTVGSATTVVSIRKRGIEARLNDTGGEVFLLDAYAADGITLHAATGDAAGITALEATSAQLIANDAAWTAALAAVQAVGGGTIQLGPGTYIAPSSSVILIDNLTVAGCGMFGTVLKHRKASSYGWLIGGSALATFVSAGVFRNNCTFRDFAIDGDRTNNNNATTGLTAVELAADGTNNVIARVRVFNWNYIAMTAAGVRNSIYGCRIEGPLLGSYTAFPTHDYGGFYGIAQPGNTATSYNTVIDNVVYGCRINGLTSLGDHAVIAGNVVYDNNRTLDSGGSSGGQISIGSYTVTGVSHAPRYALIAFNTVGGSTLGTAAAHGIEINTGLASATVPGSDVVCIGNAISGQTALGIVVNDASVVLITNNTVRACVAGGIAVGAGLACSNFSIANNTVIDTSAGVNVYGISIAAGCAVYNVSNNILVNNGTAGTAHYSDLSANVNRHVWGNLVGSGTAPANYVATDVTLAGDLAVTGFVWTTFTPTFDQGGAVAGNAAYARYRKLGKLAHVQVRYNVTAAGSAGNALTIVLPSGLESARTGAGAVVGQASYLSATVAIYTGVAIARTSLSISMYRDNGSDYLGIAATTAKNTDTMSIDLVYELA